MIAFPGWLATGLEAVKLGAEWLVGRQKAEEREDIKEDGRNEQKVADQGSALERAREQNAREEDLARLDGPALDDRMRKSMED